MIAALFFARLCVPYQETTLHGPNLAFWWPSTQLAAYGLEGFSALLSGMCLFAVCSVTKIISE